jgi:hypothetical protein
MTTQTHITFALTLMALSIGVFWAMAILEVTRG